MLIIGAELNGLELVGTLIDLAIMAAMKAEHRINGQFVIGSAPAVNVVFCVPGKLGCPGGRGARIAKYSAKRKLLLVQIAVPVEMVHSDQSPKFVLDELRLASTVASDYFSKKSTPFSLPDAEELIRQIADQLTHQDRQER